MRDRRLTATDIGRAETIWIKSVQGFSFDSELRSLCGHSVATLLQKQLNLFLKELVIIKVALIILQYKKVVNYSSDADTSSFYNLLIMHRHNQVFHDGIRERLNLVRETHWIKRGRELSRESFVSVSFVEDNITNASTSPGSCWRLPTICCDWC